MTDYISSESIRGRMTASETGGKLMIPWIYADLDTIIDSYSEPPEEE